MFRTISMHDTKISLTYSELNAEAAKIAIHNIAPVIETVKYKLLTSDTDDRYVFVSPDGIPEEIINSLKTLPEDKNGVPVFVNRKKSRLELTDEVSFWELKHDERMIIHKTVLLSIGTGQPVVLDTFTPYYELYRATNILFTAHVAKLDTAAQTPYSSNNGMLRT